MSASRGEYYLLAYKILQYKCDSLYEYYVPEEKVGLVRYSLYKDKIPHAVGKDPGKTGLKIYTTHESSELEKTLGCKPYGSKPLGGIPNKTLNGLISSTVRLEFMKNGWISAPSKLYNPNNGTPLIKDLVSIYEAVRFTVDDLGSNEKLLFMDPAYKIEFNETLDQIREKYPKEAEKIRFVKIKGSFTSFYIVDNDEARKRYEDAREKIAEAIYRHQGSRVSLPGSSQEIITAVPRSLRLNNILREEIHDLPLYGGELVITPLPIEILVPVGTLENISLFGVTPRFTIGPHERVKRVNKIVKGEKRDNDKEGWLNLEELCFKDIEVKIDLKDPKKLFLIPNKDLIELKFEYKHEDGKRKMLRNWWREPFKNAPSRSRLLLLITLKPDMETGSKEEFSNYNKKCLQAFGIARDVFSKVFETDFTKVSASLENLDNELLRYSKGYDEKFAILFYDSNLYESDLIARFELKCAERDFYPHVVDLGGEKSSNEDTIIRYKLKSIERDFAVRVNSVPSTLQPPPQLQDFSVVGIDSTIVPLKERHLYIAVAVTLIKPDGNIDYKVDISSLDRSDIDALASAIQGALKQNPKSLIIVNKSSLDPFIERLGSEVLKDCILVGVTKTHSYSRILAEYGGKFSNVDSGLFVKLAPLNNGEVHISRYLAITTSPFQERYEPECTIRPVLFNIAGEGIKHDELLKYLLDLTHYAPTSQSWLPSTPWPLHKSHELCRKAHRILNATGNKYISILGNPDIQRKL
ncbi:MAG: hypothetical protein NDP13_05280 [Crenarchaeota archaeon]|nr:hypothetical protein [Thermoproteota archaeon]